METDLNRFCAKHLDSFPALKSPFSQGEKTWATDGHTMVGVPRINNVDERRDAPIVAKLLESLPSNSGEGFGIPDLSDVPRCSRCKGVGKNYTCHECEGRGSMYFETEFAQYEPECAVCDGEGEVDLCENCDGFGIPQNINVSIGGVNFTALSLHKISVLPNVKIYPLDQTLPARLEFDGGDGLIMPAMEI